MKQSSAHGPCTTVGRHRNVAKLDVGVGVAFVFFGATMTDGMKLADGFSAGAPRVFDGETGLRRCCGRRSG